ncbi:MAG: ferritin [Bacteroidales bacterium]|nr:ferritin [Bacteroidales bacterium]
MKINEKVQSVLNKQVNAEFWSAYMYLSMSAWFEEKGLKGFANWMRVQFQEETAHALKIYDFVLERQGTMQLTPIEAVPTKWSGVLNVMEETYKHECKVTAMIYNCLDVAEAEKDRATVSMLQWYVDEQIEEETNVDDIINQLKLIGDDGQAIYLLDKELATRVFVDPTLPKA